MLERDTKLPYKTPNLFDDHLQIKFLLFLMIGTNQMLEIRRYII